MLPATSGQPLLAHFLHQTGEIAQAADRLAPRPVDHARQLPYAAQQDRPPHRFETHPGSLPVRRQTLVGGPESSLHAGGLAAHLPHPLDIRTHLPGRTCRGPRRRLRPALVGPVLLPHPQARTALLERLRADASQTLLLVQDTTTLNYTNLRRSARGLGPLQDRASSSRGLFVHASVGFTAGGRPLGVSGLEQWARPEQDPGRTGEHEKESARWFRGFAQGAELGRLAPGKRVVVVGDRESDIFALFQRQAAQAAEAGLLVRAHAGRQRKVQAQWCGETRLRELAAQPDFEKPVVSGRKIVIDSQGGKRARPKRTATTELRIGQVQLQPPKEQPGAAPLAVWLVRVLETDPPAGEAELEWLLVSSEGGRTAEWAERIVGWYEARWSIEEYFRVLKSGAHSEERQLRDAAALGKCLVFDAITAWQVFSLQRYAREAPQTPAAAVLSADERAVVERVVVAERLLPPRERGQPLGPDIRTWVVLLARMAGWQPSKRHPLPGNEVLWRANVQLQMMVRLRQATRGP